MESVLKFLVILVIIAGMLWVVSPIINVAISGGISKPPDLMISDQEYEITPLNDTECFQGMCEIRVSGELYNFGGAGKNILITILFFDKFNKNIGGANMPMIEILKAQQTHEFLFTTKFTCDATSARAIVMHSVKA
jgi:hypothetical protein